MTQLAIQNPPSQNSFGKLLRYWRGTRKMSQLDLALDADISTRYLSFIETGKSQPSRKLVLHLAHLLRLPYRQCNALLMSSGYAPQYPQSPLDAEPMRLVKQTLQHMLTSHDPYPAIVISPAYDILMNNNSFQQAVVWLAGEDALDKYPNIYRLVFAQDGLRPYIEEWEPFKDVLLSRLFEESMSTQHEEVIELYETLKHEQTPAKDWLSDTPIAFPIMSFTLCKDGHRLQLFSTITTFGTALDVTVQELRIESMFPADPATRTFLDQFQS